MIILGIHGGFTVGQHDPGAALMIDGDLVAMVEEERLLRVKSPRGAIPVYAISAVLKEAGITMKDVDLVAHPGETYEDAPPRISSYLKHYFGHCPELRLINHQLAHLASAFFPSPFERAMVLSYDAYGDRLSAAIGTADRDKGITVLETRDNVNSLGQFYATMTSYIGFLPGEDEYKVMGLAPYGEPRFDLSFFASPTNNGFTVDTATYMRSDPRPKIEQEPFYSDALVEKLGPPRERAQPIEQRHRDIAASAQHQLQLCAKSLVEYLHGLTGEKNLCMAGGVALNCSANYTLQNLDCVDALFVQPAASDRGLALGCAIQASFEQGLKPGTMNHVYYGPSHDEAEMEAAFKLTGLSYERVENPEIVAAELLHQGEIIGWYQGRSEFGPRALGNRSILADPRRQDMKDLINARVKFREEFRPFAPSVLEERASEVFKLDGPSPFMTIACGVQDEWVEKLPATTHVNKTARVQTVSKESNDLYYGLIKEFDRLTGVPVVLNTSFNIKGQPIVETPLEAISTFCGTGLSALVVGPFVAKKPNAPTF